MQRVLFLTWDGPDQRYLESLFFPIFAALSARGFVVDTLQLTWAGHDVTARTEAAARSLGLEYRAMGLPPLLRKAALPLWMSAGSLRLIAEGRRRAYAAVLPRSIVPAGIVRLARAAGLRARFVYEADGLAADERVDFAGWSPSGGGYQFLRAVEAESLRNADAVVMRTERARETLLARAGAGTDPAKFFVIPNAKSAADFGPLSADERGAVRSAAGIRTDAPWLLYTGTLGPQYLVPEMLRLFEHVRRRRPDARFHVLTWKPRTLADWSGGASLAGVEAVCVPPGEVARWLGAADLGLALRAEKFSQRAVCPIKVIEYLMSGLPVLASPVGDLAQQLGSSAVGRLFGGASDPELARAARWVVDELLPSRKAYAERARALAVALFDLPMSVERYSAALSHALL